MSEFDPRSTPARADLAAAHLEGTLEAPRFFEGREMQVALSVLPMTRENDPEAALDHQLVLGQGFTLYDSDPDTGLAWGQAEDGYVGYVPHAGLESGAPSGGWLVTQTLTHLYPEPDFKTRPFEILPMGSRVSGEVEGDYLALEIGGFIPLGHLCEVDTRPRKPVKVAESFSGAPYLWGGTTAFGIDCSGLVQKAFGLCGYDCPRDSDQQMADFGRPLAPDAALRNGDLLFWKGHVGLVFNATTLLHANAHHMAVVKEPLVTATRRISAQGGGEILARRRP